MEWSTEEKEKIFDILSAKYYKKNFGTFSKADCDLLMFSFYIEKMVRDNSDDNNVVNYNICSDYTIAKELGITPQKVRNLKIKKQLVYPIDTFDWKKSLASLLKNARYDDDTKKITLMIPDPNLLYEIEAFLEEHGGYICTQLNKKLLQVRVEYFFELAVLCEEKKNQDKIIKAIKKELKEKNKSEKAFDDKNIGKSLLDVGVSVASILDNVSSLFTPGNIIKEAVLKIINFIKQ